MGDDRSPPQCGECRERRQFRVQHEHLCRFKRRARRAATGRRPRPRPPRLQPFHGPPTVCVVQHQSPQEQPPRPRRGRRLHCARAWCRGVGHQPPMLPRHTCSGEARRPVCVPPVIGAGQFTHGTGRCAACRHGRCPWCWCWCWCRHWYRDRRQPIDAVAHCTVTQDSHGRGCCRGGSWIRWESRLQRYRGAACSTVWKAATQAQRQSHRCRQPQFGTGVFSPTPALCSRPSASPRAWPCLAWWSSAL